MLFRTEISTYKYNFHFDYNHKYFFIGSCFSDHMGYKFDERYFHSLINPFGTCFNPVSIAKLIDLVEDGVDIDDIHFNKQTQLYFHYDFHTSFSSPDRDQCFAAISQALEHTKQYLKNTQVAFITLGTAWVYSRLADHKIVSNCHKMQSGLFNKKMLTIDEIKQSLDRLTSKLKAFNSQMKIIFTLSPVRHIKDGIEENMLSKSRLLCAIHDTINNEDLHYFPAYEIMMDDLRDYRFYKSDMIHPNDQAIEYIWDKLVVKCFDSEIQAIIKKVEKINLFMNHRPTFENSSYLQQKASQLSMLNELKQQYGMKI